MPRKKTKPVKKELSEAELDELLLRAAALSGETFPMTPEAVKESHREEIPPLPVHLQIPEVPPERKHVVAAPKSNVSKVDSETRENLALAARNGGEISTSSRELMDQDRTREEEKVDRNDDG